MGFFIPYVSHKQGDNDRNIPYSHQGGRIHLFRNKMMKIRILFLSKLVYKATCISYYTAWCEERTLLLVVLLFSFRLPQITKP